MLRKFFANRYNVALIAGAIFGVMVAALTIPLANHAPARTKLSSVHFVA